MAHTWDPDRYLTYADERGRPFVELVARIGATAPARGRGPRLRPRQPHRPARRAVAGRPRGRARLESGDDRRGRAASASRWPTTSPTCATGSPSGRSTYSSATRPSSGCRATSSCCRRWSPRWRPAAGSPSRCRATSTSRATRSGAELAAEAPYAEHTAGVAVPVLARPGRLLRRADRGRLLGGRLGDDVPHVLQRRRPGLHLGVRHRRPPDPPGAAGRPAAELRGGVQAPAGRGLPGPCRRHRAAAVPSGLRGGPGRRS